MFLIFTACMLANPDICKENSIQIFESITHNQCMNQAMFQLAQWSGEHYEWKIKDYTCSKE